MLLESKFQREPGDGDPPLRGLLIAQVSSKIIIFLLISETYLASILKASVNCPGKLTEGIPVIPVDNFGTVVGENPTPYGILALWVVNGLSIVYWDDLQGFPTELTLLFWKSVEYASEDEK